MQQLTETRPIEAHMQAAWHTQLAAVPTPGVLPALMRCRPDLLPRLVAYYTQLQALPRRVRRALQRQWRLSLAGIALLLALGQSPGLAATIPVSAGCTLVEAITAANTDTATGGCPAGGGADTIILPAGSMQTLTAVNNSTYGPTGLPVVSSTITIEGNHSTIQRASSAPDFRIFVVSERGNLTLQETTVSGGWAAARIHDDAASYGGGVLNLGLLTIANSTLSGNTASYDGGGVANKGTLTITNSTISGNESSDYGGGGVANAIFLGPGSGAIASITNSTLLGNTARFGSGVANGGTLTITHTLVSGNSASEGPEISNLGGSFGGPGTVTADNFNLFGVDGTAGVEGFTPGPTDIASPRQVSSLLISSPPRSLTTVARPRPTLWSPVAPPSTQVARTVRTPPARLSPPTSAADPAWWMAMAMVRRSVTSARLNSSRL